MSDVIPITSRRPGSPDGGRAVGNRAGASRAGAGVMAALASGPGPEIVRFTRAELDVILNLYGRMVALGEWRDYALADGLEVATFAVFRRSAEMPIYRIEKRPKLAKKQGAFAVIAPTGLILKRGHDLAQVLRLFDKPREVSL